MKNQVFKRTPNLAIFYFVLCAINGFTIAVNFLSKDYIFVAGFAIGFCFTLIYAFWAMISPLVEIKQNAMYINYTPFRSSKIYFEHIERVEKLETYNTKIITKNGAIFKLRTKGMRMKYRIKLSAILKKYVNKGLPT